MKITEEIALVSLTIIGYTVKAQVIVDHTRSPDLGYQPFNEVRWVEGNGEGGKMLTCDNRNVH